MAQFFKCWLRRSYIISIIPALMIGLFNIGRFIYSDPISGFDLNLLIVWVVAVSVGTMLVIFSFRSTTLIIDENWFFLNGRKYDGDSISSLILKEKEIIIRRSNKQVSLTLYKRYFRKDDWKNIKATFERFAEENEIRIKK